MEADNARMLEDILADLEAWRDSTGGDYAGPGANPGEDAQDTDRPDEADEDIADGFETEESVEDERAANPKVNLPGKIDGSG